MCHFWVLQWISEGQWTCDAVETIRRLSQGTIYLVTLRQRLNLSVSFTEALELWRYLSLLVREQRKIFGEKKSGTGCFFLTISFCCLCVLFIKLLKGMGRADDNHLWTSPPSSDVCACVHINEKIFLGSLQEGETQVENINIVPWCFAAWVLRLRPGAGWRAKSLPLHC